MKILIVENRKNSTQSACERSLILAKADHSFLEDTDGGHHFNTFRSNYTHLSSNSSEFELICFRRYFILLKYLENNPSISNFILADSDVLAFEGLTDHISQMCVGLEFMGSSCFENSLQETQISPHLSYWTRGALEDFIAFLLRQYTDPASVDLLRSISLDFQRNNAFGGVSDMTLLKLWSRNIPSAHINNICNDGVIDHNVMLGYNGCGNRFRTLGGAKLIKREGNRAFFFNALGPIPAYAIHFQGRAKIFMSSVLEGATTTAQIQAAAISLARITRQAIHRIS